MQLVTVQIDGMTCGHCVEQVTNALEALKDAHVHSVQVGRATVSFDPQKISSEVLFQAIEALGYKARREPPSESEATELPMSHDNSVHHHHPTKPEAASLTSLAFSATAHCLTGCAIGEVLGMVVGTYLGLANMTTVAVSVVLAFVFGYLLTIKPLLKNGVAIRTALGLAFASDTLSIATMEVIDNAVMLIIPGAMDAGLGTVLFWGSLAFSLMLAFLAAVPVNRWLLSKGRGHALVHQYHHAHSC
jgi:copper chaperone CopZ